MSLKNKTNRCQCTPTSPCDEQRNYCCLCYSHQWYNSPRYSECSRRIKVNDLSGCDCGYDCGCNNQRITQDNFSFNTCGCESEIENETENNVNDFFNECDEMYW